MDEATPEEKIDRVRRERDLYRRLLELGEREELEPFIAEALELVAEITGAQQAYLELRDPQQQDDDCWDMSLGCSESELSDIRSKISRGIIAESLATGHTIMTPSAMLDERFQGRESVRRGRIQGVICAPIGRSAARGVVYLQGRREHGAFSSDDREAAEIFALNLAPLADRLLLRRRYRDERDATRELRRRYKLGAIVGRSQALARALESAMLAAPLDVTVLLTGRSGTGKTEVARIIHANSPRAGGPFLELNCASLPETLIESELFGAKAGSHSEARKDMPGKVEAAEGGTLFLDEIGDLPVGSQAKLLQLLQSKRYYPLGGTRAMPADVRIVAATNADLEQRVEEKRFREDLFYRLNVVPIRLPSLSERKEDVRDLCEALCERVRRRHGLPSLRVSLAALHAIEAAEWPGNVRQLENAIESAAIRAAGEGVPEVGVRHLFPDRAPDDPEAEARSFQAAVREFQRDLLQRTLRENGWNVSESARQLDLARSYVYELIRAFGLERD